ncbi:hypothetical protein AGABI2DRAFT_136517 [Agaricus bisporus var. bisporus H97]|uniref:hypothetical protein n=1 Tax=Agaricus bisporus var. bisporus (strain H97 / ATCC MYA-4626 / FGSC 10389) TaxID=936046 RepID=UPI00029F7F69|nr:hypothetical protein AGABI2DRAFT_136517 [Agaricus bisporus var. bisporus H97]EKV46202.1 hypothetical protein AGABI2DRAFT_136517 [Agaricus bisporus var. bisporus H97]
MKVIAYIISTFAFLTFATASPVAEAAGHVSIPSKREPFTFDHGLTHVSIPSKREPIRVFEGSTHVTVPHD